MSAEGSMGRVHLFTSSRDGLSPTKNLSRKPPTSFQQSKSNIEQLAQKPGSWYKRETVYTSFGLVVVSATPVRKLRVAVQLTLGAHAQRGL